MTSQLNIRSKGDNSTDTKREREREKLARLKTRNGDLEKNWSRQQNKREREISLLDKKRNGSLGKS